MRTKNNNTFLVIVQFDTKHVDYAIKRHRVTRYVQKRKGVRFSPGVYVMDYLDIKTPRQEVIDCFVKAGMLDKNDRVICIEAANWTIYPESLDCRQQHPRFPVEDASDQ